MTGAPCISIVVPALDEAAGIGASLAALQAFRAAGAEVIVVDGASRDATRSIAAPLADRVIEAPRGRASQMNAGAAVARADALLFLHADTTLPAAALQAIAAALREGHAWGRFDVTIARGGALLRLVGAMMNARSRLTGIATGDQAIFVRREAFERVGRFPAIALMEDVALAKKLKRVSRPACLRERVVTSDRRWRARGTIRTIVLMWWLRFAYAMGADPGTLARRYDPGRA
ncbi:MAG TPA: TIGR04283 family arsenosugar biosynthesis glycosyltransferase [Usitatibacter sp.]|nr:TIGR04283 family arsenosugar biosynthesis glycosyltransferase [Usitatibacter sp.]